jgi:hypothetical protein
MYNNVSTLQVPCQACKTCNIGQRAQLIVLPTIGNVYCYGTTHTNCQDCATECGVGYRTACNGSSQPLNDCVACDHCQPGEYIKGCATLNRSSTCEKCSPAICGNGTYLRNCTGSDTWDVSATCAACTACSNGAYEISKCNDGSRSNVCGNCTSDCKSSSNQIPQGTIPDPSIPLGKNTVNHC